MAKKKAAKAVAKEKKGNAKAQGLSMPVLAGIGVLVLVLLAGAWYFTQGGATPTSTTTTTLRIDNVNSSELSKVDANYSVTPSDVCLSPEGKPLTFFFGTTDCEFCDWERPLYRQAMQDFGDSVDSRMFEIDKDLSKMSAGEKALFLYYNTAQPQVPVVILGCKYFRIGVANATHGEQAELAALRKLTCGLFNATSKPSIC